jgi:hypothetical protein
MPDDDDEAGEDGAQHPLARCQHLAEGSPGEADNQASDDKEPGGRIEDDSRQRAPKAT